MFPLLGRSRSLAVPAPWPFPLLGRSRSWAVPALLSLLSLLSLTAPPAARAGSYGAPAYSGGTVTATIAGAFGSPFVSNYSTTSSGYGGSYYSVSNPGDTVNCQGQITTTFTWQPAYTGEPFPQSVIIKETASAGYGGPPGGGNAASDGLGDPVVGGTSQGTRYKVVAGAGTLTLTCSPSASVTAMGQGTGAGLSYTANAYPVTISLAGTTPDSSGNLDILVGQGCTASLNTPPFSVSQQSGWTWNVSGTTFQSWSNTTPTIGTTPANANASYYVSGSGPLTNSTAHWFWNDLQQTPETVSCTATVTPPSGQGSPFTVTATQQVTVQVPGWSADGTGGYMQINTRCPNQNGALCFYAGPSAGELGGMNWTARSFTPQTPVAFGTGTVELVQTVTPNMSYTAYPIPGVVHNDPENNQTGLDTGYPYPGSAYTEGSIMAPPYTANDSPYLQIGNSIISAMMQHQFIDWLMYLPPSGGNGIQWVPRATFTWSTNGSATIPNTGNWSDYVAIHGSDSAGTVTPSATTNFTAGNMFPSWTRINVFPNF